MAPKRPSHLDEPPAASSSEEKEEISSEEEEEEEDPSEDEEEEEEEVQQNAAKKPKPQPSKSDGDSSSDSEPEDLAAAVTVAAKPISSRPMDAPSAGAKKPRSKPPATPSKRPSDDAEASKSSKRSRKKSAAAAAADHPDENGASLTGEESKKPGGGAGDEKKLFQRLWSEDDEIVILKGMIDYASKKGSFPTGDNMEPFHDSIKKSIHFEDFTKSQLADKVRRLRKKFQNNFSKKDYDPTKTHDKKIFDLSKKIWGSSSAATPTPKANGFSSSTPSSSRSAAIRSGAVKPEIASPPPTPPSGGGDGVDSKMLSDGLTHLPRSVVSRGLDLVPEDKKAELLAEWEKIHLAEIEIFVRKSKLMSEQAKLISEALKHSN